MNDTFVLPNGQVVGTGLIVSASHTSTLPAYEGVGPMLQWSEIEEIAKSKRQLGRDKFDRTYISHQQHFNSCNGFAAAKALERARVRRGLDSIKLSGAYLYSLINNGRDNGSLLEDGMNALQSRGCATESTVPYDRIYPHLYDKAKADAEAAQNRAFECYAVRTKEGLFSAVALGFDVIVAVHVERNLAVDTDGIALEGDGPGNHAVSADGVDWSDKYRVPLLDAYNSWGVQYGNEGRMRLMWERHLAPTNRYHLFYAIRSTVG